MTRNIFKIPASALPGYVGAEMPYGYVICRVNKRIVPILNSKENQANLNETLQQFYGQQEIKAYLHHLKEKYPVEVVTIAKTME
jgi:hypothetical protein